MENNEYVFCSECDDAWNCPYAGNVDGCECGIKKEDEEEDFTNV